MSLDALKVKARTIYFTRKQRPPASNDQQLHLRRRRRHTHCAENALAPPPRWNAVRYFTEAKPLQVSKHNPTAMEMLQRQCDLDAMSRVWLRFGAGPRVAVNKSADPTDFVATVIRCGSSLQPLQPLL